MRTRAHFGKALLRFFQTVRIQGDLQSCWLWQGRLGPDGYAGNIQDQDLAHRWAYRTFVGPLDAGLTIDHVCRNRACVSPFHLEQVTATVNKKRGAAAVWRRPSCVNGHLRTPENTYVSNGAVFCYVCNRATKRRQIERARQHGTELRLRRQRATHCPNGHEFTPENTRVDVLCHRYCRACNNAASRRYRATRTAQ